MEQVSRFARHFGQSPEALGPEDIRAYQVYLTNEKKLAPGSILIAVAALRFLYKVTLKKDWSVDRHHPGAEEAADTCRWCSVRRKCSSFSTASRQPKHRTILTTCYAAGLRISEAVQLTSSRLSTASGWSCASSKARGRRIAT